MRSPGSNGEAIAAFSRLVGLLVVWKLRVEFVKPNGKFNVMAEPRLRHRRQLDYIMGTLCGVRDQSLDDASQFWTEQTANLLMQM